MAEHEPCVGASDEWYTPPEIFAALGLKFDLDPCSPGVHHWVPAHAHYTIDDDGLAQRWFGLVFVNAPFGGRHGQVPWLVKFLDHGNGIAIVRAYTSSDWFHDHVAPRAETLCFPRGKTKFVRGTAMESVSRKGLITRHEAGSIGTSPGHGVVLIGMGTVANEALRKSQLGLCLMPSAAISHPNQTEPKS